MAGQVNPSAAGPPLWPITQSLPVLSHPIPGQNRADARPSSGMA
jgi:hypothetical protein